MINVKNLKVLLNIHDRDTFEFRFMVVASFSAIMMCFVATIFNFILNLGPKVALYSTIATILFSLQFMLIRIKWHYKFNKYFYFFTLFIILDLLWFENGGLSGSIIITYLVMLPIILFTWSGFPQIVMVILFFTNLVTLILVEYYNPELPIEYSSRKVAILDISISLILYLISVGSIILTAKKYYIRNSFVLKMQIA